MVAPATSTGALVKTSLKPIVASFPTAKSLKANTADIWPMLLTLPTVLAANGITPLDLLMLDMLNPLPSVGFGVDSIMLNRANVRDAGSANPMITSFAKPCGEELLGEALLALLANLRDLKESAEPGLIWCLVKGHLDGCHIASSVMGPLSLHFHKYKSQGF